MNKSIKGQIEDFIAEGKNVKGINYKNPLSMLPYIAGCEYDNWMNKIKVFSSRYLKEYPLYDEIIDTYERRNNQWGTTAYDNMMSYLTTLAGDGELLSSLEIPSIEEKREDPTKMLFISHSSLDIAYVKPFIDLLEDIGFGGRESIFCSSLSGYWIPKGQNIYDYLKEQFDKDVHVILFLSDNYYSSPACMNEMGATWIKSKKHTAILTPGFKYSQINGAIDATKIWFNLNDKERLNDFKNELISEFSLVDIDVNIWERKRDEYLKNINEIYNSNKYKNFKQQIEVEDVIPYDADNLRCVLRFINRESSQQVCKNIEIILNDNKQNTIKIVIPYNLLKQHVVFGNENKRTIIDIPKSLIPGIGDFDLYRWKTWSVDSFWSSYTD